MVSKLGSFDLHGEIGVSSGIPVFQARHTPTGQSARVYLLRTDLQHPEITFAEFFRQREIAVLVGSHPRAWACLEAGTDADMEYFGVEEPPGETLASYMAARRHALPADHTGETLLRSPLSSGAEPRGAVGTCAASRLSPWTIRGWLSDLASVVDYVHQNGVVLGNLTPYNVWICPDGRAMLMGPGSPNPDRRSNGQTSNGNHRHYYGTDQGSNGNTRGHTNGVTQQAGSHARYLAPEQLLGRTVGPPADVYAIGVLLFWLLGGEFPPSRHEDTHQIGRYLPLPQLGALADPPLAAICRTATCIKPSARFRTADLLRAALLSTPEDLEAAQARASHAARCTMIHGMAMQPVPPQSVRDSVRSIAPGARFLRWLQEIL